MIDLVYVIIGGFFEPAWVMALDKAGKTSDRAYKAVWYGLCLISMILSLYFLSLGMRTLNIGISYAIWTAVGSVVTLLLSRLFLKESFNILKIVAVMMILVGISGLELAGGM